MHESPTERDALAAAAEELEQAEAKDDDERLSALDAIHARLSNELDKPAGESPAP